jgi:hypothetical protein
MDGVLSDSERNGDLAYASSVSVKLHGLFAMKYSPRLSNCVFCFRARSRPAIARSQLMFLSSDGAEDRKNHFPHRGGCVDGLVEVDEVNTESVKLFQRSNEMARAASKPADVFTTAGISAGVYAAI